ncbi:Response regulator PleD [Koleobacter methoxysyntrophicus]|uniref:Response regulator PleD n=1 Tax=Koleobacter methoxysyntrophicus TaxID=2751313 RepID=A0A8A0RQF6_9FIRM|nr:diguanylate cyclase [Koleobacter methoxysyntrophicus]QSQ09426.1 Response regulator PleD [Koleobacter methoxysyntrophicus]
MKSTKRQIDGGIILILIIFAVLVTFIFIEYQQLPIEIYFLFALNTLLIVFAYSLGLVAGLIGSMAAVFCYGTYLVYGAVVKGLMMEVNYQQVMWLFLFPLSSYISGRLSLAIKETIEKSEKYIKDMEELVLLDKETGFSNSKKFYLDLSEEISKSKRYGTPLSIMLIKLQYFDELRSIYGNEVCSNAVINISRKITELSRDIDKKARLEADKFALILSNTDEKGALVLKERLVKFLENLEISDEEDRRKLNLSFKIGIAQLEDKEEDAIAFKERAERELEYDVR